MIRPLSLLLALLGIRVAIERLLAEPLVARR
jgi:hypothetical protein